MAEALTPALEGWADRYRTATRSLRRGLLLKTLKTPVLYTPALRRLVMASGLGATPVGPPPPLTEPEAVQLGWREIRARWSAETVS